MRVAIVEDEKTFARELLDNLDRFAKEQHIVMDVRWFSDGLQLIGDYKPEWDLILLDIDMPGMDGITTAHAIRGQDKAVLIMFVTNLAQYAIKGYDVSLEQTILLLITVGVLVLALNWIIRVWFAASNRFYYNVYIVYDMACCIVLLMLQLQQKRELELRAEVLAEQQLRRQLKEQYVLSKESIEIINEKSHDLKHQIGLLRSTAGSQEQESLIKSLEEKAIIYDLSLQTDNEAVNVVFTEKGLLCKKYGIQWTCMIDGASLDFMTTVDIYTLFGNTLDNAIEASRRLSDIKHRVISASSRNQSGMLTIEIENYYESILQDEKGKFITSKSDSQNHGFGLNSMGRIVARYGGHMAISTDNNIFRLVMMFPRQHKF